MLDTGGARLATRLDSSCWPARQRFVRGALLVCLASHSHFTFTFRLLFALHFSWFNVLLHVLPGAGGGDGGVGSRSFPGGGQVSYQGEDEAILLPRLAAAIVFGFTVFNAIHTPMAESAREMEAVRSVRTDPTDQAVSVKL